MSPQAAIGAIATLPVAARWGGFLIQKHPGEGFSFGS